MHAYSVYVSVRAITINYSFPSQKKKNYYSFKVALSKFVEIELMVTNSDNLVNIGL